MAAWVFHQRYGIDTADERSSEYTHGFVYEHRDALAARVIAPSPNRKSEPKKPMNKLPFQDAWMLVSLTLFACSALGFAPPTEPLVPTDQLASKSLPLQVYTFEHIGMDPATKPMLDEMLGADGKPKVCERVWISSIGCAESEQIGKLTAGFGASTEKIGPELTSGLTMQKLTDAPILIIKTSWGGKSLHTDFRPPSAGPYVFNEALLGNLQKQGKDLAAIQADKAKETGVEYDDSVGYQIAGFAWFQGWNDMVDAGTYPNRDKPGGYDQYSSALTHFIRDVRKDLNAPKLPFVIGVLGVGGPTSEYGPDQLRYKSTHDHFRAAMAAPALLPEFQGNVATVLAEKYWDGELTRAKAKEKELEQRAKAQAKEEKLSPQQEKALVEQMRREGLSDRQRLVIEKGISNLEFHYLGSAKILGGVGKGLAEAMAELKQLEK